MSLGRTWERFKRRRQRREFREVLQKWRAADGDRTLRLDYPLERTDLVLDFGGYEGQWASDVYAMYRCRLFVFEPVAEFSARIEARFRHNDDIKVFPFGLGASTRRETIYVEGAGSSLYRSKGRSESIEFVDVVEWLADNAIDSVALAKINIEGGEFELLERLIESGSIGKIRDIQVQFHYNSVESPRRMEAIQHALSATHEPTYQFRFVWEGWTRRTGEALR